MRSVRTEGKPQNLEDVIAGISLYRPGPMDFIPKYIKGKNNQDSITYPCPQLEPILAPTYGYMHLWRNSMSVRFLHVPTRLHYESPAVSYAECIASCGNPMSTVLRETWVFAMFPRVEPPAISARFA